MKLMLKIALAGLIGFFLNSCFSFPSRHACCVKPVAGRVVDRNTGKGVAGAKIECFPCFAEYDSYPRQTCNTDANGFFMLEEIGFTDRHCFFIPPAVAPPDLCTYEFKISATGYKTSIVNVDSNEIYVCIDLDHSALQDYLIGNGFIVVILHPKP